MHVVNVESLEHTHNHFITLGIRNYGNMYYTIHTIILLHMFCFNENEVGRTT